MGNSCCPRRLEGHFMAKRRRKRTASESDARESGTQAAVQERFSPVEIVLLVTLVVFVLGLPFFCLRSAHDAYLAPKRDLVQLVAFVAMLPTLVALGCRFCAEPLSLPTLGLLASCALSMLAAVHLGLALDNFLLFLGVFVVFLAARSCARLPYAGDILRWAFAAVGAILGVAMAVGPRRQLYGATLGNPNFAGHVLAAAMPFVLFSLIRRVRRREISAALVWGLLVLLILGGASPRCHAAPGSG